MTRNQRQVRTADLLLDIEAELRRLALWAQQPPSAEAFASTLPFCYDTLTFPEWLQFVLLPRLKQLIESDAELPSTCGIAPMAEEMLREDALRTATLVRLLQCMDETLSAPAA